MFVMELPKELEMMEWSGVRLRKLEHFKVQNIMLLVAQLSIASYLFPILNIISLDWYYMNEAKKMQNGW